MRLDERVGGRRPGTSFPTVDPLVEHDGTPRSGGDEGSGEDTGEPPLPENQQQRQASTGRNTNRRINREGTVEGDTPLNGNARNQSDGNEWRKTTLQVASLNMNGFGCLVRDHAENKWGKVYRMMSEHSYCRRPT